MRLHVAHASTLAKQPLDLALQHVQDAHMRAHLLLARGGVELTVEASGSSDRDRIVHALAVGAKDERKVAQPVLLASRVVRDLVREEEDHARVVCKRARARTLGTVRAEGRERVA